MDKVATASINTLRIPGADAQPSEDPIFVLTASQLRAIITEAVQDVIQPMQDEVSQLRAIITRQGEEIKALRADEKLDHDDIRDLFDALASLEQSHIQPMQKDRGENLRALIAANGGKMLAKDARQKMHLPKNRFSELLAKMEEDIETKPLHSDKRKLIIILKSKLVPRN